MAADYSYDSSKLFFNYRNMVYLGNNFEETIYNIKGKI